MNHIILRRIALSAAAVSFGLLAVMAMLWITADHYSASTEQNLRSEQTQQLEKGITVLGDLPIEISCTPLVVKQLAAYDGKFFEDGSGREVMDVAAVLLYNSSDRLIPYAYLTVRTENCQYTFDAYMLPPKSSVLVPDRSAQRLTETNITDTFGWTTVKNDSQRPVLEIREQGMGSLRIQNLSGKKLRDLTVYYRTYISDGEFYLGGKVFQTQVAEIPPGETAVICPANYASGYSKVIYYE